MRNAKMDKLAKILKSMKRVVVAYSGGLDSTFLLKMAIDTLGNGNVLAVTARSETYPLSEYKEAMAIAKRLGANLITIKTRELADKRFRDNPVNRCYYCKKELFNKLIAIGKKRGIMHVVDGANIDDLKDVRYGMKAGRELGVRSPLLEAKMTKSDIRKFSKKLKLPTWDKPSFACLASRVPFNHAIDQKVLARIEKAEDFIKELGVRQVRVRAHKDVARIEVMGDDIYKILKFGDIISERLKSLGFVYTTLDLLGYRTGSMHEVNR
jgi:uncharacterized protein